ncbi:hypothetical protein CISIN_1g035105mg [Citrus sinensis]|uniref:Uncharacterized protein n=1 Tax=Citrus sinensis TaxID=2711 RepID=A0A067FWE6_CITSI|nr:hypothetical protein CISIN_1g035105mg [Citrus sinensis]
MVVGRDKTSHVCNCFSIRTNHQMFKFRFFIRILVNLSHQILHVSTITSSLRPHSIQHCGTLNPAYRISLVYPS